MHFFYGKLQTRNQKPLMVMTGQMFLPQNQRASFWTHSPFCGYADHRRGRETNFLTDSSFNIHPNVLQLHAVLHFE